MNTPSRTQWPGRFRALVIDDRDPLFKMRVKVRIPDLMIADEKHVGKWDTNGLWASPSNNYLGGRTIQDTKIRHKGPDAYYQGSCLIPPKGTHVWVWFEKNDVSHPFYDGAAEYGDVQALPENQLGNQYQKKWTLLKTCKGRCLVVSDDDDDARFEITGKKRQIKEPPFGDIDSVYKIDDNQSVFLIDERPQHEKILLKDYRGNFMKLIQDENGLNDQLHVRIQNDVHWEFQKDFYWTIFGNMHIKVLGDIYVTCLKNIFVNATLKLQETALSIDRFATTYDNTFANLVNVVSGTNINQFAVMKIFEQSIQNVRNSMITSDVSAGLTTIQAGAAIGITAGGAVSIYGGGGTAIQSTPVTNPLSGNNDYAEVAPTATEAKPDPERYEKIILPPGGPILTTPTSKDSLKGDKVCHDPVPTSQCASSRVGSASGSSAMASTSAAGGCGGGGGGAPSESCSGGGSKGSSNGSGASQGESGLNAGACTGGGCGGSPILDPDSDVPYQGEEPGPLQTIGDCCSGIFDTVMEPVRSGMSATGGLLDWLGGLTSGITDEVYATIGGLDFIPYTSPGNFLTEVFEKGSLAFTPYYDGLIYNAANDLMFEIVHDTMVEIEDLTGLPLSVYTALGGNWDWIEHHYSDWLPNEIQSGLHGIYTDILPDDSFYATTLLDSVLSVVQGNIGSAGADWDFEEALRSAFNTSIEHFTYDFTDGYTNNLLVTARDAYNTRVNEFNDFTYSMVTGYTRLPILNLAHNMVTSIDSNNAHLVSAIRDTTNIVPYVDDTYIAADQLNSNLLVVQQYVEDYKTLCRDPIQIEKFKSDPDLLDDLNAQLVANCKTALVSSQMPEEDVTVKFASANDKIAANVTEAISPLMVKPDEAVIAKRLDNVNQIIVNDLEKDSYALTSDFNELEDSIKTAYSAKLSDKIKEEFAPEIEEIIKKVPRKDTQDTAKIAELKEEIVTFSKKIKERLGKEDVFAEVITTDDIKKLVDDHLENVSDHFPRAENNTAKQALEDFREQLQNDINTERKETLASIFDLDDAVDNTFSKYSTESYTVPSQCGCGFTDTIFMKEKYRKTLPALTAHSGGNAFSCDLIKDTSTIKYEIKKVWNEETKQFDDVREYHPFFDTEIIESYEKIWTDLDEGKPVDTTGKWWISLRDLLNACAIYDIVVVLTIQDFRNPNNPFIRGVDERKVYTDAMWRDDYEGKFLTTLFNFVKETHCKVIYNIGYGAYKNPYDPHCEKYKIYPNCGYLRRFIMWCVYKCGITSNIMALTANEDENLYYYNPYCEWRCFDDGKQRDLDDSQIVINDKSNGKDDVVTYTKGKITGGYSNAIINSSKHSIPVFAMNDLTSDLPAGADINDPNIMSMIFCSNSRAALRYFKGNNYFDFEELHFDEKGDVI